MKKTILTILLAPLLTFCQSFNEGVRKDTAHIVSFTGNLAQPVGFGYVKLDNTTKSGKSWGSFINLKFAVESAASKSGTNHTKSLGAVIHAIYNDDGMEDPFYQTANVRSGAPLSFSTGWHLEVYDNIYFSWGFGLTSTNQYAQYYSKQLGRFYFKTERHTDLIFPIGISTTINDKFFIQAGVDIFPEYDHQREYRDTPFNRLSEHASFSNMSFGFGYIF